MTNYKIINLSSGKVHLMNEEEKTNFFKINYFYKNGMYQYKVENLTESKNKRINKILDFVAYVCIIAASMLITTIYINTYY